MPTRFAEAQWNGDLFKGDGTIKFGSGAFEGRYSFASRFESGTGTNPEELIGAAHAGCFSMALSGDLAKAGYKPESIHTTAMVHIDKDGDGFSIWKIELDTKVKVKGIEDFTFQDIAEGAKRGCPVSKALTGVSIVLTAKLI
ncbi:MAG: OsmC family protein [Armatimonadota bacterium]